MRRRLSLAEMFAATVLGVASGLYIYKPLLQPPARKPPRHDGDPEGEAAPPSDRHRP